MNSKAIKVAVVFWRLGPYHHARLNAAGQRLQIFGVESCGQENTNAWEKVEGAGSFQRITLTERHVANGQWRRELKCRMFQALDELKPQVVAVPGWSLVDALTALLWCSLTQTPAIVMSDSTALDAPRVLWKECIKKRVVNLCSSALVAGTRHREYVLQLGMSEDRIFHGYDVVDNAYFAAGSAKARSQWSVARAQLGLPEHYFIASARFIEKKNLLRLIEAYARYRAMCAESVVNGPVVPWHLVLLGDGPLQSSIFDLRSSLGLDACVHLPGYKQYPELPAHYAGAGAFIHASTTDQWGLVVNEAMASGLPVLVSNRCGCAPDLVHEGVNGFTFDPYNVDELARLMLEVSAFRFPLSAFGDASRRIVSEWGPERFVSGLESAAAKAIRAGPRPSTLPNRLFLKALIACGKSD